MIERYFTHWLSRQPKADILPSQITASQHLMERLGNGDLILTMYHDNGQQGIKAYKILKERFDEEMSALDDMNKHFEDNYVDDRY
jgi:hypothetical protein